MTTSEVTINVPLALKHLINANNKLLRQYQQELFSEVQDANIQLMELMQLKSEDGWRLDLERMVYVRTEAAPEE